MLIPFPIALWIFSFVCDVIYALGWGGALWTDVAFYTMAGVCSVRYLPLLLATLIFPP